MSDFPYVPPSSNRAARDRIEAAGAPMSTSPLADHLLADIRTHHAAATPGPWLRDGKTADGGEVLASLPNGPRPVGVFNVATGPKADAEANMRFVAHAHKDIGRLLTELDRTRNELDQLREDAAILAQVGRLYLDALDNEPENENLTLSEALRATYVREAVERQEAREAE